MTDRVYQMTRVGPGDYLVPSNDGRTLWRIHAYEENGSASFTDGRGRERKITGRFWACARWHLGMPTEAELEAEWFLEWTEPTPWVGSGFGFTTRSEALDYALSNAGASHA